MNCKTGNTIRQAKIINEIIKVTEKEEEIKSQTQNGN